MSYKKQLQALANEYMRTQKQSATTAEIARWAIANRKWQPHPGLIEDRLAEELSRAMREEFIRDAQGRTVRAKHVARVKRNGATLMLWDDMRSAPRTFMAVSFKQRRQQIVNDCHLLKQDVDSYNQNASPDRPIQMVFDFRRDLAEFDAGKDDADAA